MARAGGSRPPVAALLRRRSPKISGVRGHDRCMSAPPVPANRKVYPLRDALYAALITFATSVIGLSIIYFQARDAQVQAVRSEVLQLATTGAAQIDVDLHAQLVSSSQEGSPEHERALAPLVRMHRASKDVLFMYTAIMRDGKIYWILDTARHYRVPGNDVPADPVMILTTEAIRICCARSASRRRRRIACRWSRAITPISARMRRYATATASSSASSASTWCSTSSTRASLR